MGNAESWLRDVYLPRLGEMVLHHVYDPHMTPLLQEYERTQRPRLTHQIAELQLISNPTALERLQSLLAQADALRDAALALQ
jgi:hypothetical protein